jgi:hypothetical protein
MKSKNSKKRIMQIGYEELERRRKEILPESMKIVWNALDITTRNLQGLRYSEIEMFILLLNREVKKSCYFDGSGFENPPLV